MNMICFISCLLALFLGYPKGMVAQGDDVAGKPRVVCYTRSGIPPKLGNALHLGYSEDGQNYMALNNDACIMALRKVDNEPGLSEEQRIPGVMKTLTNPYLFRMKDNGFGVVALRTDKDGMPDSTAIGAFLFVRSRDLVDYEPEKLCHLPTKDRLEAISCEYDKAVGEYRVRWKVKEKIYQSYTSDFSRFSQVESVARLDGSKEQLKRSWHHFRDACFGNSLVLTPEEGRYLKDRLGRITNVGVLPLEVSIPASSSAIDELRKKRVTLLYSDGSKAEKRVIWNEEDLRRLDSAVPGTYTLRGTVFQYSFNYPVSMSNRADPNILYNECPQTSKLAKFKQAMRCQCRHRNRICRHSL